MSEPNDYPTIEYRTDWWTVTDGHIGKAKKQYFYDGMDAETAGEVLEDLEEVIEYLQQEGER